MIRLIRGNIERLVDTDEQAEKLKAGGFERLDKAEEESAEKSESGDGEHKALSDMTVRELRKLAEERGLDIPSSLSKNDLLEILGSAEKSEGGDGDDDGKS